MFNLFIYFMIIFNYIKSLSRNSIYGIHLSYYSYSSAFRIGTIIMIIWLVLHSYNIMNDILNVGIKYNILIISLCLGFSNYRWNIILLQNIFLIYLLYWVFLISSIMSILFIKLWSYYDFYIIELINIKINSISWFMILIILFVSSCVNINSINYLSIMDNSLFLFYFLTINYWGFGLWLLII